MGVIIAYTIVFLVYFISPKSLKAVIFIINLILPDSLPYIDEVVMFLGLLS